MISADSELSSYLCDVKGSDVIFISGPYYHPEDQGDTEEINGRSTIMNGIITEISNIIIAKPGKHLVFFVSSYREHLLLSQFEGQAKADAIRVMLGLKTGQDLPDQGGSNRFVIHPAANEKADLDLPRTGDRIRYSVGELIKFGRLYHDDSRYQFVIGFCDFKNSTDLLSATASCYFRSIQNKLLSRMSEVLTRCATLHEEESTADSVKAAVSFRGFIDKYAGDNIMFYFIIRKDAGESMRKAAFRLIHARMHELMYTFSTVLEEVAVPRQKGDKERPKGACSCCDKCTGESQDIREGFVAKFQQMKKSLGLRIGLVLGSRPAYLSMLGISARTHSLTETDYTFTGEDVNLAARIESLKEDTMLKDLEESRHSLERYRSNLYDLKGVEQTSIMKSREAFNLMADDIHVIAGARLSLRINKDLYRYFAESTNETATWRKVKFIPKGFTQSESVFILAGDCCRRLKGSPGHEEYELY